MERAKKAAALFEQGYNCAQAVAVAFCDLTGQTPEQAAQMASAHWAGVRQSPSTAMPAARS